jgi:hypothetical protein
MMEPDDHSAVGFVLCVTASEMKSTATRGMFETHSHQYKSDRQSACKPPSETCVCWHYVCACLA